MFKFRKKYVSVIVSLLLAGTLLCGSALAAEPLQNTGGNGTAETNWSYTDPDGKFEIETLSARPLSAAEIISHRIAGSQSTGTLNLEEKPQAPNITYRYGRLEERDASADVGVENSARVTGPDLAIQNLTANLTQPFPYLNEVTFAFEVENIGTVTASSVDIDLYIDGKYYNTATLGELKPRYFAEITWPLSKLSGPHEIKFQVSSELNEINYTNNSVKATYTWADVVDLTVYAIESDQGNPFESSYHDDYENSSVGNPASMERSFTVAVANYGNKTAYNVELQLFHNDVAVSGLLIFPAFEGHQLTLLTVRYIGINTAGTHRIGIYADPNNEKGDRDQSDNYADRSFTVTYDSELFAGRWTSASALSVNILPDCLSAMKSGSEPLTESDIRSAIQQWNGITANVSFGVVSFSESNADIILYSDPNLQYSGDLAVTHVFLDDGLTEISDVLCDAHLYKKSKIAIAPNINIYSKHQKLTALTHELGHALGLKHAFCDDVANMQPIITNPLLRQTPQPHDSYNIIKKYG